MAHEPLDPVTPDQARDDFFAILATAALVVAMLAGLSAWLGDGAHAAAAPAAVPPVVATAAVTPR